MTELCQRILEQTTILLEKCSVEFFFFLALHTSNMITNNKMKIIKKRTSLSIVQHGVGTHNVVGADLLNMALKALHTLSQESQNLNITQGF